jgi:hypothetical protein
LLAQSTHTAAFISINFNGLSGFKLILCLGCSQLYQQLRNTKGAPMMLASQPMALKNKIRKIINGWPMALILFGVVLTLIWLVLLVLFPLRLLDGLPPEKWSSLKYGLWPDGGLKNAEEETQGRRDCREVAAG